MSAIDTWDDLSWWKEGHLEVWKRIKEVSGDRPICPPQSEVYAALKYTPLKDVRIVILGQDPYPVKRYAMGLAFSVRPDIVNLPKSLQNIFRELKDDTGEEMENGDLRPWAEQGVLLLNSVLTTEEGLKMAHHDIGWHKFTWEVLQTIVRVNPACVFILWGSQAQRTFEIAMYPFHSLTVRSNIIKSSHPSPLSADRGFFGSKPFSRTNALLDKPIRWRTR